MDLLDIIPVLFKIPGLLLPLVACREKTLRACLHLIHLLFAIGVGARLVGHGWIGDEEGVLHIAGRVLLWYKESIEVPEARVDEAEICQFAVRTDVRTRPYCPVGISTKPWEKKMFLNSCLTFIKGCSAPASC